MSYQYVSEYLDRHGKTRARFRRAGFTSPLPPLDSDLFAVEYQRLLAKAPPTPIRSPKSAVGQLRSILVSRGWDGSGEFVYFVQARGMVKIGFSSKIIDRITKLSAQTPTPMRLLAIMLGGREVERKLHAMLADDHIKGEWFRRSEGVKRAIAFAKNGGTFANIV